MSLLPYIEIPAAKEGLKNKLVVVWSTSSSCVKVRLTDETKITC